MTNKETDWTEIRKDVFAKRLARDETKNFQIDQMKLAPNVTFGKHSHPDVEWVYILKGKMTDKRGAFEAGDFLINEKGSTHVVTVGPEGCEMLVCWCGKVEPV